MMMKQLMMKQMVLTLSLIACLVWVLGVPSLAAASCTPVLLAPAGTFDCGGAPVALELPQDADVLPDVRVAFAVSGGELEVALIYQGAWSASTGLATILTRPTQVLTSLLFDVTDPGVVLTALEATIPVGSGLTKSVADPSSLPQISGQWAAKGRRVGRRGAIVGSIEAGTLGVFDYAVGAVGDINATGEEDDEDNHTLGRRNLIDDAIKLVRGPQPGGADFGIVPPGSFVDLGISDFSNRGPLVQNAVTITYMIERGDLDINEIENVVALFGTDGLATEDCY